MMLTASRRSLAAKPRAMLVVLLALAIELVPPPSLLVRHRHAGGDAAHVHAGRIAGVAGDRVDTDATRTPLTGSALAHAASPDLHAHFAPPAVVAALPSILPPAPAVVGSPLPLFAPSSAPFVVGRPTRARAPPPRIA
jgi:hypothetical protein